MDYRKLTFQIPKEKVDLVSTFLIAGGYDTFEVADLSDLAENAGAMFCDYVEDDLIKQQSAPPEIRFYFDRDEEEKAIEVRDYLLGVCGALGDIPVKADLVLVENSDWDTRWKQYFYPFPVGEKLFILPSWEEEPEEARGRIVIRIDPAAAFGSGTHATTRLCLEGVEKNLKKGDKVLDMGCGSGILGIGAALLGAREITAVDVDEAAVRTAGENFEKNGVPSGSVRLICGDVLSSPEKREEMGEGFDLICANIVAGIICLMAPLFFRVLNSGGVLIASGILSEREEEVRKALAEAGFTVVESRSSEEWVCLELTK